MAAKNGSKPKLVAVGAAIDPNDVVQEVYKLGALIAGAKAIAQGIHEATIGKDEELEIDSLHAKMLLDDAMDRIAPLAELVEEASKGGVANG